MESSIGNLCRGFNIVVKDPFRNVRKSLLRFKEKLLGLPKIILTCKGFPRSHCPKKRAARTKSFSLQGFHISSAPKRNSRSFLEHASISSTGLRAYGLRAYGLTGLRATSGVPRYSWSAAYAVKP